MKIKQLTFALMALMLGSCATDPQELNVTVPFGAPQIHISGAIDNEQLSRVDESGFCEGDQVGLYGVNYTDNNATAGTLLDEGNQVDNARYTYSKQSGSWSSSGSFYYKDANTNIDLYAYYPFSHPQSVSAYEFAVERDQNSATGYAQSDFLWAKAEGIVPSENKVRLGFRHRLALVNVVLTQGAGFAEGEFESLSSSVLALNTTRTATIDLSTGVATATGEAEAEGIVMKVGEENFRAIVVPQSVNGGTALFAITLDGITYRFKRSEAVEYQAGKMHTFTIEISKKSTTGTYELNLINTAIEDWAADLENYGGEARQYFVVHLDEPCTLGQKIREANKNPNKIKNLKVSGQISRLDFEFMRDSMAILQAVNIKESKLVASWYYNVSLNDGNGYHDEYFIGEMPESYEERYAAVRERYPDKNINFSGYGQLSSADEIPTYAFRGKTTLAYISFPEVVTKIGNYAFRECSLLSGALVLPDMVTEIGDYAFEDCNSLTTLDLPVRLEKIGRHAFNGCRGFTGELNLPATLKSIGSHAFYGCWNFTGELILPDGVEELGEMAFYDCRGFTGDLRIPESIKELPQAVFSGCSGMDGQLTLHDGLTFGRNDHTSVPHYYGQFSRCRFQGELKLPANLMVIPVGCFAYCDFSAIAPLPESLTEIGDDAFSANYRLMGTIEFPESLIALGGGAFSSCSHLEGIILPSELGLIKAYAFSGCYGLQKIVCRAAEPPILQSGVFDGVAKDNFALEVPESAVNKYQADVQWGEFKRIAAHHDFTISRSRMRVLNAEHSRNFILRAPANHAWSIESLPEWVTVTPSSGVGKTEVTVTVAQMTDAEVGSFDIKLTKINSSEYNTETHAGRGGEVVFLLNDKDYRTTLSIEQYDYDYSDGQVLVHQTATAVDPKKGVNIVFMGDCFDARDIAKGTYLSGTAEAIDHFFAVEPYKTYKEYFNIYTVFGMSNDSGMGTVDTIRDAKFGSQYSLEGITPDIDTIIDYSYLTETVTKQNFNRSLVVLVENTTEYGGITYMWTDGSAVAICPMSDDAYPYDFRGIVQHEAGGHGFAKLADEYIYHNAFIQSCQCNCCDHLDGFLKTKALGWYRNLEATGDMNKVGWSHLIFHPTYSNIVDIYEGGYFHTRGIYRSEPISCMNNNIPYFSAISRQEAVERIMRYSGKKFSISEFYSKDVLDLQGNKAALSAAADALPTAISLTGASKQMPPKFMGNSPFDK